MKINKKHILIKIFLIIKHKINILWYNNSDYR